MTMSSSTSTNFNGMNTAFTFHYPYIPKVSLSTRHRYDPIPQEYEVTASSIASLPRAIGGSGQLLASNGTINLAAIDGTRPSATSVLAWEEYTTLDRFPTLEPQEILNNMYNSEGTASPSPVTSDIAVNPIKSGGDGPLLASSAIYGVSQASADVATYDNDAVQFPASKDTRSADPDVYAVPQSPPSTQLADDQFSANHSNLLESDSFECASPNNDDAPSLPVDDFIPQENYEDTSDKENADPVLPAVTNSKGKGKEVLRTPLTIASSNTVNVTALRDPVTKFVFDYIHKNKSTVTKKDILDFLDICSQKGLTLDENKRSEILKMFEPTPRVGTSLQYVQGSFRGAEAYSSMGEIGRAASYTGRLPDVVSQEAWAPTYPAVVGVYPNNQLPGPSSYQRVNHHPQSLGNYADPRYMASSSNGIPYHYGTMSSYDGSSSASNNLTGHTHFPGPSTGPQPTWNGYVPSTPSLASSSSSSSSRASSILPTPIDGNFEFNAGRKRTRSDAGLDEYSQLGVNDGLSQPPARKVPAGDNAWQVICPVNPSQDGEYSGAQGEQPPTEEHGSQARTKKGNLLLYPDYDPILWIAKYLPGCGNEINCPKCKFLITFKKKDDRFNKVLRHMLKHSELSTIQCACGSPFCRPDSYNRHVKDSPPCQYWDNFFAWQEATFRSKARDVYNLYGTEEQRALALKEEIVQYRLAWQRNSQRLAGELEVVEGDVQAFRDWEVLCAGFQRYGANQKYADEIANCGALYINCYKFFV